MFRGKNSAFKNVSLVINVRQRFWKIMSKFDTIASMAVPFVKLRYTEEKANLPETHKFCLDSRFFCILSSFLHTVEDFSSAVLHLEHCCFLKVLTFLDETPHFSELLWCLHGIHLMFSMFFPLLMLLHLPLIDSYWLQLDLLALRIELRLPSRLCHHQTGTNNNRVFSKFLFFLVILNYLIVNQ